MTNRSLAETHRADLAYWASLAEAGIPWDRRSDPMRRWAFWGWWLGDAIPGVFDDPVSMATLKPIRL
jgi:hypothetical protein